MKQLKLETSIYGTPMELPFTEGDCAVTLLTNDLVTFQVITSIVTKTMRAANIRPQVPETFQVTKETRVMVRKLLVSIATDSSVSYSLARLEWPTVA